MQLAADWVETKALEFGLKYARDYNLKIGIAFTDSVGVSQAINQEECDIMWRSLQQSNVLKLLMMQVDFTGLFFKVFIIV